jgi:predicted esterase
VFAGFSQGVAMAYRAAIGGRHPAAGVVALAGDVPPELATASSARDRWPAVLIGVGTKETWYSAEKLAADVRFFEARGIAHEVCRFDGGHEWAPAFHAAAGEWLARVAARRRVT